MTSKEKLPRIPITLATFVKNEAHCLEHMIKSVADYIDEFIVVDTGSTDNTIEIAKKFGAHVYEVSFTDFGKIRTLTMHLASCPWILMLDADETLECPDLLQAYTRARDKKEDIPVEAIAFPRKRWLNLNMTQQTELEAYPDWQVRFFKNDKRFIFRRALHEEFHGGIVSTIDSGIYIHHFQDVFKDEARRKERDELYAKLAPVAGVTMHGGKSIK